MAKIKGDRTAKYINKDEIELRADYVETLSKQEFLEMYSGRTTELNRVENTITTLNLQLDKLEKDLEEIEDLEEIKSFAKKIDLARKWLAKKEAKEKLKELEQAKIRREKELVNFKDAYVKLSGKK